MASNDWLDKDFYAMLGVPKDASEADVKKAYRKLARTLHPDTNNGDASAERRFKEIGEAYSVLSDPEQRSQYDAIRAMAGGRPRFTAGGGGSGGSGGNFEDLLSGMFGGASGGGGFRPSGGGFRPSGGAGPGGRAGGPGGAGPSLEDLLGGVFAGGGSPYGGYAPPRGPQPGADITASTRLGFRQAVEGATVTLTGGGAGPARTITARIPAGVRDGQRIRLRGKGAPGSDGGPPGDLVITVSVEPHPVFTRSGDDLRLTLPVTFDEAALGADVEVPTLDGEPVRMKIPAGTSSGRTLRLRGRGVRTSSGTGDLLATVQVVVPQRLDGEARAAVEAFRAATAGNADPRADLVRRAQEG